MTGDPTAPTSGLVSCMRNEAPFLLEWVAYHSTLGFDRIFVYTNACTDGTDLMLERLQQMGVVTHVHNPMTEGLGPQASAMQHFMSQDEVQRLDWVLHIDADEFLNVRLGQGSIADLLVVADTADVMALMWRPFGNNGLTRWTGGSVLETFTATQARPRAPNAQHKSLFRPSSFGAAIDHMPKEPLCKDVRLINSAGMACEPHALFARHQSRYRLPVEQLSWENAYINHYAVRSDDIFLMKNVRGDGMGRVSEKYFLNSNFYRRQNKNGGQDTSILQHKDALNARLSEFMADPVLNFLHTQSLEAFFRMRDRVLTPERIEEWTVAMAPVPPV
ncbi:MAG: glycosyltransferase family 2 protein [Rhodobacteraceae bacterium]|nr:glycosyltransferase family 2 protein [Paracoccaceae bacterium]